ncbi:MAG TPA: 30S ribosomal protein S12 methylthiotransferase RimO [Verrucomicrobiae bacterium]|jgi:ribosomal protein S12 methylthiotransferase|nr:30S ribosomal protein S12 methylthiotransferase RimO [Verrucomicrobiae bacterium]
MATKASKSGPIRVGLISLGCAKNLVDAEIMLGSMLKDGMEITNQASEADVVIVNTCSFIDTAQEESVDAILQSAEVRSQTNPAQGLIVSGCLPQRFRGELPTLLPEVDAFMGTDQVADVSRIVGEALARRREKLQAGLPAARARSRQNIVKQISQAEAKAPAPLIEVNARPVYIPDFGTPRFRLTPRHFAYVKIAEGCNHPCSFCIIPRMRGSHRSRAQADIVREARQMAADGVKELNLISQDSTYYGLDLRANASRAISSPEKFNAAASALGSDATTLSSLLRELDGIPGDFWIRLLYTHPAHWTDELIRTLAQARKVARYVDMPLQHIHSNMLERMRRETSQQYIIDLIARIRAGIPGIALRTTFIVGFPGETEEYFQTLLDFIRTAKFERLGVFVYSQQDGTRAGKMDGQVPDDVKQKRQALAMAAQREVAREVAGRYVGQELRVLVEGEVSGKEIGAANVSSWEHGLIRNGAGPGQVPAKGRFSIARGEADAPDIDGRVYVRGRLPVGEFAQVRIVGHTDYDLLAESLAPTAAR